MPEKLIGFLKGSIATPLSSHPLVYTLRRTIHTGLIVAVYLQRDVLEGPEVGVGWRWEGQLTKTSVSGRLIHLVPLFFSLQHLRGDWEWGPVAAPPN